MFLKFKPFFIIAETSLHPGSGSQLGIVDLPIQRERYTDFPKIESSGVKGCIREAFEGAITKENGKHKLCENEKIKELRKLFTDIDEEWREKDEKGIEVAKKDKEGNVLINYDRYIELVFGPQEGDAHAGSIAFTDARILLFPVKSLKGIFAWITCPAVLERFKKDMKISGTSLNAFRTDTSSLVNTVTNSPSIVISSNTSSKIVLEEYTFEVKPDDDTDKIAKWFSENIFPQAGEYNYWREKMSKDIVILSDDDFREFVRTSTEVITRTKISNETGTVERGALWDEEYLPQDTILYSIAMASAVRLSDDNKKGLLKGDSPTKEAENVLSFFTQGLPDIIHIGGNQTIGKGIVRLQILKEV